ISKRNGKQRVSRRICTPVLHGRGESSRKDLLLRNHPQLPNQQYPLLQRRQMANLSSPHPRSLLLTLRPPLLQLWRLSLRMNRTRSHPITVFSFWLGRRFGTMVSRRGSGQFAVLHAVTEIEHNTDRSPDSKSNPGLLREKAH